ncbi:MAG: fumarylacetoacetate hydrolase family protein [Halioglobus sp.]|jgi:fumarylacetoacetate (FAA) hydrolase|uniref:FAA hydrolase family protein n=1 Tax=Candidatus Seongchinamella marina TaxID=2518990 RepID=A0ABT3SSS5_9GAMM|nr:fumarylacetoacetate hydrolase family protein [Candidatus Seongchinamella marina]EEB78304.1 fumarylacetoacetate hydrolase family protein, putative [marine gamma proteobacterium HTCC2148]MBT3410352.1 fumarylacetoacetate hydrolase family protein [Halieaceae bacterium]MDG1386816.1 fumarylacetoacetate hydrolase family protein [Halioglobus sp.]MCX2973044.1 FAA hydrolase family protein [Candidatus Seongchinamella marina]MDG2327946.1 fumarylacetoacetate hydrolase family protein [Halioglobus sp.]
MKLASHKSGRDGQLLVVSRDMSRAIIAAEIAPTLQAALDDWASTAPALEQLYASLNEGSAENSFPFDPAQCAAPLPRAYHWADGSAYVTHVELVRKARGAELPDSFWTDPLIYMGASDAFIGPRDDIEVESEDWGIDFEAEVVVITDDVPAGVSVEDASDYIRLVGLVNDVSLRNLIPAELGKQFGFYQSKPWTSFTPVLVTPDELGSAWNGAKLSLPLRATLNDTLIGKPNAGVDMTFDFPTLISHCAKSRSLMTGTVIGSGTVSNVGSEEGSCCLAEVRCLEIIANGAPSTPFMSFGDRIKIEMIDDNGLSIFGNIDQIVKQYQPPT